MEANLSVSLNDLIERGLVSPTTKLLGQINGQWFEAIIDNDGSVVVDGKKFSSLSVAAGVLITAKTGKVSSKRSYYACNGWLFWHILNANGDLQSLDQLRAQLRSE